MGFLMDGLDPEAYDRAYSDRDLVKRILSYFRPQSRKMAAVAAMVVGISLLDTGLPIVISHSIDLIRVESSWPTILRIASLVALLACTSWVFNAVRQTFAAKAVGDVVLKMREDAFDAVIQRDLSFYDRSRQAKSSAV